MIHLAALRESVRLEFIRRCQLRHKSVGWKEEESNPRFMMCVAVFYVLLEKGLYFLASQWIHLFIMMMVEGPPKSSTCE